MSCRACRWTSIIAPYIPARHLSCLSETGAEYRHPLCIGGALEGRQSSANGAEPMHHPPCSALFLLLVCLRGASLTLQDFRGTGGLS